MGRRRLLPLIPVLLASSFLGRGQTPRSLVAGEPGTVSMNNVTFSTMRVEFRIENLSQSSSNRRVWSLENVEWAGTKCSINANTLILSCWYGLDHAPNGLTDLDLIGRTNVRVRWQRDPASATARLDIWNGDCTSHVSKTRTIVDPPTYPNVEGPIIFSGDFAVAQNMTLGFLRLYSSLDTVGVCPVDAPDQVADILDLRFENDSLRDSSAHNYRLNISGQSFANSVSYPPHAVIAGFLTYKPVVRAAAAFTLDGRGSTASTGNGSPSRYLWQQVGGPAESIFSSKDQATATIVAPLAGQYTYRLEVQDGAGATSFVDQIVGAVATDARGVVITPNSELTAVLGAVTRHGTAPWPWYDATEAAVADALYDGFTTDPSAELQAGTLSVTAPPNERYGGNQFIVCSGSPCTFIVTGSETNFTSDLIGKQIYLHWDADRDSTYKGRHWVWGEVKSVDSPTQMRISDSWDWKLPEALSTGMPWSVLAAAAHDGYNPNLNNWNYYEALLGVYRLYYRTELTVYRDQARSFCELWWRYGLDSGYGYPIPRSAGWQSMMACAADNHPEWWDGIARNIGKQVSEHDPTNPVEPPAQWNNWDIREDSYRLRATALMARLYPVHTANPSGTRATWCTYLGHQITNFWLHTLTASGYWPANIAWWSVGYPAAPINSVFGTSPWSASGLATLGLEYAYDSLNDSNTCNDPMLAASVLQTIQSAAQFLWDYGRSPDGGLYYNVLYASKSVDAGAGNSDIIQTSEMPSGSTVTATHDSTAIMGSGTTFLATFAPCDGTTWIGINGASYAENGVYRITSCADNTHMTLAEVYPHPTITTGSYVKTMNTSTSCSPSLASNCEADPWSGRNLAADAAAGAAWLYVKTGNTSWKDKAEFYAGKTYGGRPGGAGSLTGDPTGPYADGGTNNLGDILPACASNPAPCGIGYLTAFRGKQFGMSAGAGNVPTMLANLKGGLSPVPPRRIVVGFSPPANATGALFTVTSPNRSTAQQTCSSAPCTVNVDTQQGDHLLKDDYLSQDGAVVAPGEQQVIRVR